MNKASIKNSRNNVVNVNGKKNKITLENAEGTTIEGTSNDSQHSVKNSRYNQIESTADNAQSSVDGGSDFNTFRLKGKDAYVSAQDDSDANQAEITGTNGHVNFTEDSDNTTVKVTGNNSGVTLRNADDLDITVNSDNVNVTVFTENGKQYLQKLDDNGQPTGAKTEIHFDGDNKFSKDGVEIRRKSDSERANPELLKDVAPNAGDGTAVDTQTDEFKSLSWGDARNKRKELNKQQGGPGEISDDVANKITKNGDGTYTVDNGVGLQDIAIGVYRKNHADAGGKSDAQLLKEAGPEISNIQNTIAKQNGIKDPNLINDGHKLKLDGEGLLNKETITTDRAASLDASKLENITTTSNPRDPDPQNIQNLVNRVNNTGEEGSRSTDYLGPQVGEPVVSPDGKTATIYYEKGSLTYQYQGTVEGHPNQGQWKLADHSNQTYDQNRVNTIRTENDKLDDVDAETVQFVINNYDAIDAGDCKRNDLSAEDLRHYANTNAALSPEMKIKLNEMADNITLMKDAFNQFKKANLINTDNLDKNGNAYKTPDDTNPGVSQKDLQAIKGRLALGVSWDQVLKDLLRTV